MDIPFKQCLSSDQQASRVSRATAAVAIWNDHITNALMRVSAATAGLQDGR